MANFISDGFTLTPSCPEFIGVSKDGVNWDLVPKNRLQVGKIGRASCRERV